MRPIDYNREEGAGIRRPDPAVRQDRFGTGKDGVGSGH